jgi:hypothetical protein
MRNIQSEDFEGDIAAAEAALAILQDCGKRDHIAQHLYSFVRIYYGHLHDIIHKGTSEKGGSTDTQQFSGQSHQEDGWSQDDILFHLPEGDNIAHMAYRDLTKIIGQPFANVPGIQFPESPGLLAISMEEICLGVHLDWSGEPLPNPTVGGAHPWPAQRSNLELFGRTELTNS